MGCGGSSLNPEYPVIAVEEILNGNNSIIDGGKDLIIENKIGLKTPEFSWKSEDMLPITETEEENVSSQVTGSETKSLEKDIEEINDIIIEEAEDLLNEQQEEKVEEKVQANEKETDEIDGTIVLESIDDQDSNNNNNNNANTSADEVVKSESPEPADKDNV